MVHAIETALADLKSFADGKRPLAPFPEQAATRAALQEAMGYADWQAFEERLSHDDGA
jgi:hypothetical protein